MTGPLSTALSYAAAGWPVFPCRADLPGCPQPGGCGCKTPLTRNGFKDATTDPRVISRWWRRWPRANVAIATGAPAVDVLDVDVRDDGSGFAAFNRLKRAGLTEGAMALLSTPSGGLHVYFPGTRQPCGRLPRHHLDFKAAGGYVLVPPSRVHGRPYLLLRHRPGRGRLDWRAVRALVDPPRRRLAGSPQDRDVSDLAGWVARQPQGNRNAGLFWAACRISPDDLTALGQIMAAAAQAGLPEAEICRTVASAARTVRGERAG